MVKKLLKSILIIIISLILITAIYVVYVLATYSRIEDNQALTITGEAAEESAKVNQTYRMISANLGFGAYSDDFSFFMDGGTESWAFSKEAVNDNITGSIDVILENNPNFIVLQEVDIDSTRSYHVDEQQLILDLMNEKSDTAINSAFAINFDSPFLMYPITQPHGKSVAGLLTISPVTITDAVRRSLPIEDGWSKFMDLDRCYSKSTVEVENGKKLVIYNVHLSAYTTNPETADNQVKILNADMAEEFAAGNYIIAGGDMNKDVLGDSSVYFGTSSEENWAQPFKEAFLDESFKVVKPINESHPVPSCRNADSIYNENSFVITIDGFIVSSNVEVEGSDVIDSGFKYSDHNPIYMDFILK